MKVHFLQSVPIPTSQVEFCFFYQSRRNRVQSTAHKYMYIKHCNLLSIACDAVGHKESPVYCGIKREMPNLASGTSLVNYSYSSILANLLRGPAPDFVPRHLGVPPPCPLSRFPDRLDLPYVLWSHTLTSKEQQQ